MQNSEKFTVGILLQKLGLTEYKRNNLLRVFIDNNIKYEIVINRISDIYEINRYLSNNNYSDNSINLIIMEMLKTNASTSRIIEIDRLFEKHNYTKEERQKLLSAKSIVFTKSLDNLDNRLSFYEDLGIRKEILLYPSRMECPLHILYARIIYLKETGKYEEYKELVFSRKRAIENTFGVKDEILIKKYPLPKKYLLTKLKKYQYSHKELTVLTIMFKNVGLTDSEAKDLINKLYKKNISYEQIKKTKDNIIELIKYFKNNSYFQGNINTIIANTTTKHSSKSIKEIDTVLINNGYDNNQRESIESNNQIIFHMSKETLNSKIKLLTDEHMPKQIITKSRVATQSLKLTYARIRFLKSMGQSPYKYLNILFREDNRFKNKFGVSSKELIEKFPIIEDKYKVKVKQKEMI